MPYKKTLLILLLPLCLFSQAQDIRKSLKSGAPVPIFYGLNESHGNDWAQISQKGTLGISYFEKNEDGENSTGDLLFREIEVDGTEKIFTVCTGKHFEISAFLYDGQNYPHIFLAVNEERRQYIIEYSQNKQDQWSSDTIVSHYNTQGKFIYEISAYKANDGSFHLCYIMTRSNPDSYDYYYAYRDAQLYYANNLGEEWSKELVKQFDMHYTMDEYSKIQARQDIVVDSKNKAHILYGEQIPSNNWGSPSILKYATNKNGVWEYHTVLANDINTRDSAGWYPSLAIDDNDELHAACCYIKRVPTGSAMIAKLMYLKEQAGGTWFGEALANMDDGYYGTDGRRYTGGQTCIKMDHLGRPHLLFTDIASSHTQTSFRNYLNLGNIRYAKKEAAGWNIKTIYRQGLPAHSYSATEIYGQCLVFSPAHNSFHAIAQEITIHNSSIYQLRLVIKEIERGSLNQDIIKTQQPEIKVFPNPCSNFLNIDINDSRRNYSIKLFNSKGNCIFSTTAQKSMNNQSTNKKVLNLMKYPPGIYFLKCSDRQSSQSIKIVIES